MIAAMLVFKRDSEKELLQQRLPEILKEDMMAMSDQKLTKKELNTISWRYILASQLNWNYERGDEFPVTFMGSYLC